MTDAAPPITTVAVRELCEFTAKTGDLDLRFTPAPTAQEGIAGHQAVTGRRDSHYLREIKLETHYGNLHLRGRADGMQPTPLRLEEIKTYRGALSRMPANHRALHWAQLKIYGAQLCELRDLQELTLTLVYYDVDRQHETPFTETFAAETLTAFYRDHCDRYLVWNARQQLHQLDRNAALTTVAFPHADFHAGQRLLAEGVYRAVMRGQSLLVQAPTGIGKSIGSLFPSLKAMAMGELDKIFYLTAKTSGRQMALNAIDSLQPAEGLLPLRVLELVARDKCCVHPDKACHGDSCPLAQGFYDRLPAARESAVQALRLDQRTVAAVAQQHTVCPYYLSQDLVRWADVVVGDYNYYFDQSALLHSLTVVNEWKIAVLVDEAHNLIERGRAMYSAELDQRQLLSLKVTTTPPIKKALTRLNTAWNKATRDQEADYATYLVPLLAIVTALDKVVTVIDEHLTENPTLIAPDLRRFYFDALNFLGLEEQFGVHSLFDVSLTPAKGKAASRSSTLCIRNVVPAPFLKPRLETAHTAVGFSATLNPPDFYRNLLGLPEATPFLDVPSPFCTEQLQVRVAKHISTRYQHRTASLLPIAELIVDQYRALPGNYLAFFSSYHYLDDVLKQISQRHPELPVWAQAKGMGEQAQADFLNRFTLTSQGVGFAVLGGSFAEGIDLPGRRLIGAFVATLGLPQVNPINEQLRERMDSLFAGAGRDYIYLFPGLQKVVQAAGRVIRTKEDRGVVHLIDDRFAQTRTQKLLPTWWSST